MNTSASALIEIDALGFAWPGQAELLDIPRFRLEAGERLFLKGPSGSGKTTLLGLLGGVQVAQRGRVSLLGHDLGRLSAGARDRLRVEHSGYIFQQFNLLPFLAVRDNVELPCRFSARRAARATAAPRQRRRGRRRAARAPGPEAARCTAGAPTSCRSASSSGSPPPAR